MVNGDKNWIKNHEGLAQLLYVFKCNGIYNTSGNISYLVMYLIENTSVSIRSVHLDIVGISDLNSPKKTT